LLGEKLDQPRSLNIEGGQPRKRTCGKSRGCAYEGNLDSRRKKTGDKREIKKLKKKKIPFVAKNLRSKDDREAESGLGPCRGNNITITKEDETSQENLEKLYGDPAAPQEEDAWRHSRKKIKKSLQGNGGGKREGVVW